MANTLCLTYTCVWYTNVLMKLSDWMSANNCTDEEFGRRIGRERSTVTRLRLEKAKPSFEVIEAVFAVTDGKVSPNDWFAEAAE